MFMVVQVIIVLTWIVHFAKKIAGFFMSFIILNRIAYGRIVIKLSLLLCGVGLASACVEHSTAQYVPGYYSTSTYTNYQGTRYHRNHYRDGGYYSSKSRRSNYPPAPHNGGYYSNSSGSNDSRVYNSHSEIPSGGYYSSKETNRSNGEDGYTSTQQMSSYNNSSR